LEDIEGSGNNASHNIPKIKITDKKQLSQVLWIFSTFLEWFANI